MLRLDDGTLVLAATDLTNHLACAHLTQQRLAIARGDRAKPRPVDDPHAELIRDRGETHEREQLESAANDAGHCPGARGQLERAIVDSELAAVGVVEGGTVVLVE